VEYLQYYILRGVGDLLHAQGAADRCTTRRIDLGKMMVVRKTLQASLKMWFNKLARSKGDRSVTGIVKVIYSRGGYLH